MTQSKTEKGIVELQEVPSGPLAYAPLHEAPADVREIIRANVGTDGVSRFDLDKVTVPAGGGMAWSVPTLAGTFEPATVLEGIVVGFRDTRAYWPLGMDEGGGNTPPDCASDDTKLGVGVRWEGDDHGPHNCITCPLAQFGSAKDKTGEGQACKQNRNLFFLRVHELIPIVVQLPPTSLTPIRSFFLRLASRGIPYYGVVTNLGLNRMKAASGKQYAVVVPGAGHVYDPAARERLKAYVDMFDPIVKTARVEPERPKPPEPTEPTEPPPSAPADAPKEGAE